VAKMVLNDFLRGKIPWFSAPPKKRDGEELESLKELVDGREGRLGEMPKKMQHRVSRDVTKDHVVTGGVDEDDLKEHDIETDDGKAARHSPIDNDDLDESDGDIGDGAPLQGDTGQDGNEGGSFEKFSSGGSAGGGTDGEDDSSDEEQS
jgi:nuclear GTP-binding protein